VLRELHISGLGVIDDLDLSLHPGLNVLTGETGAGKTMITVGLALALGARATASLVRGGVAAAQVQALFETSGASPEARATLGPWDDDGELLLARVVPGGGKATARIGGQLATASVLASLGAVLVEVHGQHQAQRLLRPAVQTAFLDRFAGDEHLVALAGYREAFEELRTATATLQELHEASRDRERELALLAYQVREIEEVDPEAGESERLAAEEARLGHVERLLEIGASAETVLVSDGGAADVLGAAARDLEEMAGLDPAAVELAGRGTALAIEVAELARDTRSYRDTGDRPRAAAAGSRTHGSLESAAAQIWGDRRRRACVPG
jgi:DNA repair protein RecN (Recombination protein N)